MARAIKGGEYGANGEWYKGGQYLNTVAENEKKEARKRAFKAKKVCVAPYTWEMSREGFFPIFMIVGTIAAYVDRYDVSKGIKPFQPGVNAYGSDFKGHDVADLCERFNSGERFAEEK